MKKRAMSILLAGALTLGMATGCAGGDMDMSSLDYAQYLEDLVKSGELAETVIDEAVRRVLTKKFEFGLFERDYALDQKKIDAVTLTKEHLHNSLETAKRSAVLLKNDGTLPIGSGVKHILIVGALADDRQALLGPWAFTGSSKPVVTIVEGMRNFAPSGAEVHYVRGFDVDDDTAGFAEAYEAAKKADLVIAVAGEPASFGGAGEFFCATCRACGSDCGSADPLWVIQSKRKAVGYFRERGGTGTDVL